MKKIQRSEEHGFTIIELLIATMVFGVMMLLAAAGMVQIGRAYYKGILTNKTQDIVRSVEREITDVIRNGSDTTIVSGTEPAGVNTGFGITSRCIGPIRYSYAIDAQVSSTIDNSLGNKKIPHALWVDKLQGPTGSCVPLDLRTNNPSADSAPPWGTTSPSEVSQSRDLLATRMRLSNFVVNPSGSTGATVSVRVMYGDGDAIDELGNLDPTDDICVPSRQGGQFCAFSATSTFVERR